MTGLQRKVETARCETAARFSRGVVVGSQLRWTLRLACGHVVYRYRGLTTLPPTKALCKKCVDDLEKK